MKIKFLLILLICAAFAACQSARQAANDADTLTQGDSPATNPTQNELDAAKSPCDNAANDQEAETCAKTEFDKSNRELEQTYNGILNNMRGLAAKTKEQDKTLSDKYNRDAQNLTAAQNLWLEYRKANCVAEKESAGETNTANFIESSCLQRVSEDRLDDLKAIYLNK